MATSFREIYFIPMIQCGIGEQIGIAARAYRSEKVLPLAHDVVIVIEDDDVSMTVFRAALRLGGYECVQATTQSQAIEQCRNLQSNVKAVIADLILPKCRGTDVALELSRTRPGIRVLFVSATPLEAWTETDKRTLAQLPPGSFAFLGKPFKVRELLHRLEGLAGPRAESQHA